MPVPKVGERTARPCEPNTCSKPKPLMADVKAIENLWRRLTEPLNGIRTQKIQTNCT